MKFWQRWEFLGSQDIGEDPYLDRLRLVVTPFFSVYLHHIHRDDGEQAHHDHPWWFASLVLTGGYDEVVWPDKRNAMQWEEHSHRRWSLHRIRIRSAHTITRVRGPLWTLVLCGPPVNPRWGFFPEGKFVPWQDYDEREDIVAGWPAWKQEGILK